ncbi:MAG TPA: outer membrane protein [Xanthobacteraceae bacterium]|jgi:outer membrane immunogenic protein
MTYKGFLLATAGGLAMAPGAQAADMQLKAPALVPPPPTWTGWYIGGHAGANWQQASSINNYTSTSANSAHTDGSGFIGGGQIGYNWQHGNSVFGLEGDISWLGGGGSWTGRANPGKIAPFASNKVDWLSTVRGRIGLAVGDTMVYATGGVAIGHANNAQAPFDTNVGFVQHSKSEAKTKVGWVVGGGIEHMWDQHWTVGLEGLFVDLGKSTASVTPLSGFTKSTTFSNQIVIGRVKLNYKF